MLIFSVRVILFGFVWAVTFGKHHLWIFPNLTEDVGIIESFMPLYQHDVVSRGGNEEEKSDDATGSNTETQASAEAEASVASSKQEAGQIASGAEQEASQASGDDGEASEEQQNIEPIQVALDNAGEGNESENSSGSKHSLGDEYEMVEPDEVKAEQDP